ncbi:MULTISPECIES: alanine/glycine:cation symporter family protein [Croceibacter]|jgi:AGCS family alanine or glycine:cation symporter|uniref:alanine/glycine:cation symporter family protein n=1 Tax=Croceibacter TaxID=216431 RepID=UPI000C4D9C17|nr:MULTISPECIES: alanine/glycine:cation symporter family protein [Croceibacter]MBG25635.1 D-alanine glycine permease [Croceibacter sp.]MBW4971403.1 alanine:cation symporter family protein [Croceibacter atlanticus]HAT70683.1 D-alanine glycine permease [Flavobacteriaceae bacterium]|tara:strand:- start:5202 stop:6830 length:1629 start_codon:yes stop_codon:yes gene_type:complete
MRKQLLSIFTLLIPIITFAQEQTTSEKIDAVFSKYTGWFVEGIFYEIPFSETFQIPWVLIVLIGGALFFTIYFKFINITGFSKAIQVVRGKYEDIEKHGAEELYGADGIAMSDEGDIVDTIRDESADGEVSHFQALTAALSATVGLGNIAGVAVALSIGGPGATFWMIVAGLLGMASKFAECTLGVKYRDVGPDGTVYGGPMYYLKKGLKEKGLGGLGKVLAVVFAIFVIGGSFGGGNMFQANQAAAQFVQLFDIESANAGMFFGIGMAVLVAVVIIGGIKRIASVTEKIVPFMAGIYVLAALIILGANFTLIDDAFGLIFEGAFSGLGIAGGLIGVMIQGIRRGAFSNEAGVGSAAIAHSAVRTKYPASEGIVALLEPFVDTVVICTMTALVIIITNFESSFMEYGTPITEGVELTATAFDTVIPHFSIVLTIAVILFAFSTMISWSYYGMQGWKFLFGKGRITDLVYKFLFLMFVIVGASISLGSVIDFSDAMIFAMVVPNIIGVILLSPKIKKELKKYNKAISKKHNALEDGATDVNNL